MSTYATVRPAFWARGSGKSLRGDAPAQVLALYLMTCQHANVCGIFHIGIPTISHETGLPAEEILELFSRLEGIALYDEEEELCFVPNMAKHQIGDELKPNDKRRPKLLRELQQFQEHEFYLLFLSLYDDNYCLSGNKGLPDSRKPPDRQGKVRLGIDKEKEKTTCPDAPLPEKAIAELAEFYSVSEAAINAAIAETRGYWLVGGGAGMRRSKAGWNKTFRTNIKYKHEKGLLTEPERKTDPKEAARAIAEREKAAALADQAHRERLRRESGDCASVDVKNLLKGIG